MVDSKSEEIRRVPLFYVGSQESLDSPIDRRSEAYRSRARQAAPPSPPAGARQALLTPPNVLTFLRLVLVPVFAVLWFGAAPWAPAAAAATFIVAALTDWLDGFLARKLKMTSAFGAFLDPVADKIMVSAALVLLAAQPPAPLGQADLALPVLLIISREITMSSLREWAAASGEAAHKAVKVNSLGKWKTALQMTGMSALLVVRKTDYWLGTHPLVLERVHLGARAALGVLWLAAFLSVWSLSHYLANVWSHFIYPHGPPPPPVVQQAATKANSNSGRPPRGGKDA